MVRPVGTRKMKVGGKTTYVTPKMMADAKLIPQSALITEEIDTGKGDIKKRISLREPIDPKTLSQSDIDKIATAKKATEAKAKTETSKATPKGDVIELTEYGRKGISAYIVPVKLEKGQIIRDSKEFDSGTTADAGRSFQGKANTRTVDLSNKPDGWYEYQEGAFGTRHSYRGYLKIEKGKIVDQTDRDSPDKAKAAFLNKVAPTPKMPSLSGSSKQISWAESIREKAIRSGKITESQASKYEDSRWWIDNRSKF